MNRIDVLMKQSYYDVDQNNRIFSPEKFAELIVREVISVYNHDGYQTPYEEDVKVLNHFGIKNDA